MENTPGSTEHVAVLKIPRYYSADDSFLVSIPPQNTRLTLRLVLVDEGDPGVFEDLEDVQPREKRGRSAERYSEIYTRKRKRAQNQDTIISQYEEEYVPASDPAEVELDTGDIERDWVTASSFTEQESCDFPSAIVSVKSESDDTPIAMVSGASDITPTRQRTLAAPSENVNGPEPHLPSQAAARTSRSWADVYAWVNSLPGYISSPSAPAMPTTASLGSSNRAEDSDGEDDAYLHSDPGES
ncbi:hypothetical protein EIP91_001439 [Steccherinum ochraceum]|uniref:Uncharacterized protein n=1 Tax=Steccherinum ochraceum TaxID=92696 RepID=A0A4R0RDZ7_9APHY|nr:hypothetical protein EIP91_001439 [Steccherinum ochraceum]